MPTIAVFPGMGVIDVDALLPEDLATESIPVDPAADPISEKGL